MNFPISSTNHPKPAPPTTATTPRAAGEMYEMAMTSAVNIMSPPQMAWEMWSVPFPTWG